MSSVLAFNTVKKGGSPCITPAMFANGTGALMFQCTDRKVTTGDGKIHWTRLAINRKGRLLAYDDRRSLMSGLTTNTHLSGSTQDIALHYDSTELYKRRGVMHGSYIADRRVTQIDITFDSEINFGST